jgi:hypothetical protein
VLRARHLTSHLTPQPAAPELDQDPRSTENDGSHPPANDSTILAGGHCRSLGSTANGWYGRPRRCHCGWYDTHRIQRRLGYLSPDEHEAAYTPDEPASERLNDTLTPTGAR